MRGKKIGDYALDSVIYICLTLMGLATLLPFANVLSKSISKEWAIVAGKAPLPGWRDHLMTDQHRLSAGDGGQGGLRRRRDPGPQGPATRRSVGAGRLAVRP